MPIRKTMCLKLMSNNCLKEMLPQLNSVRSTSFRLIPIINLSASDVLFKRLISSFDCNVMQLIEDYLADVYESSWISTEKKN